MKSGLGRNVALAVLLYAGGESSARAVSCNIPEPGNCYSEGVIVDCSLCDPDPAPAPDPTPAPEIKQNNYGFGRPVLHGTPPPTKAPTKSPPPTKTAAPAQSCKLVRYGIDVRTVCTEAKAAPEKKEESPPTQGEAVLRAATVSALGATVKLAEGDIAGASTILFETDELVERAGRIGIPSEMSLDYLNEGEAAALSERFSGITATSPAKLAAHLASSAGRRNPRPGIGYVKAFLREQPGGEHLGRAEQASEVAGQPQAPAMASVREGPAPAFNAANYAGTRAYLDQMGYGGQFKVSDAPPPGLYRPSRPRRSPEADLQELSELKAMLRSAAQRRLGREPAAEEIGHSLFERVSRRIRILAPELEKMN